VISDKGHYPNGSEFVASDMPRLDDIISRKIREGRATVIAHDDGSDVVIEPRPDMPLYALAFVLLLGTCCATPNRRSKQAARSSSCPPPPA
jgi:hypothetical protein